jgi:uncharacterized protein (UPF0335 family)
MARPRKQAPDPMPVGGNRANSVSGQQLKAYFERIERLTEEKKALADDIRDVFAEAKGSGFDPKIMRIVLRRRAADRAELAEQDALVDLYSRATGAPSPARAETGEETDEE